MSKTKQSGAKRALKTHAERVVKTISRRTFHAPIVAYAFWRLTLGPRPKRFKLIFHTLKTAKQHHRKSHLDGPIQKLTSALTEDGQLL